MKKTTEPMTWFKQPIRNVLYNIPMEELQIDWNQTLMTKINQAIKFVDDVIAESDEKFVGIAQPQLSCSNDCKEIIESLAFYFKDKGYFRSGLNGEHVMVDFDNPKPNTLKYMYAGVSIEISLLDRNS